MDSGSQNCGGSRSQDNCDNHSNRRNISFFVATGRCAGCGACVAICPRQATSLRENDAGFLEAAVEPTLCVSCGLCQKVCLRLSREESTQETCKEGLEEGIQKTSVKKLTKTDSRIVKPGKNLKNASFYAMQSVQRDTVMHCSSGGVAHELAEAFLAEGGKVVGAAYDLVANRVLHRVIMDQTMVSLLDGSKYLQSDTSEAFATALREAGQSPNAQFLVFGTPCQIAGMAAATEQSGVREQFLLVEIFCHGIPSVHVWEDTLRRVRKKLETDRFDSVQFRYKKDDWHSYCLRIEARGRSWYGKRETELFWQVFFENILLNDACWDCKDRCETSYADLRLGDYWGAQFRHRSDGISAVFALTPKGKQSIEQLVVQKRLRSFPAGSAEEMLRAQNMAGYSQRKLHDRAMEDLRRGTNLREVVKGYRRGFTGKQKLKRYLLTASAALPDGLRARLRKRNSARKVKG